MPKRHTLRARDAGEKLLRLLEKKTGGPGAPLPTVRVLGEQFGVNYATVSRLLQRFVKEGRAWQHPNGRFFPAHAGPQAAEGLPIVVLGRQIQNWSRLYQEIIEGVSENCSARGCPLLFLSSDKLVSHQSPEMPPVFASRKTQAAELGRITSSMPRLCAGVLLDHLWEEELIAMHPFPPAPLLLLARSSRHTGLLSIAPDFAAGARMTLQHLSREGCKRIYLGIPFSGDQAVDAAGKALCAEASADATSPAVELLDCSTPEKRKIAVARLSRLKTRTAIVCTEDNVASLLWQNLLDAGLQSSKLITLVSMQGTGAINLPVTHLRYDYRQLGRDAVTAVIERNRSNLLIPPALIRGNTICAV
jgi:DNA-binding LacI/PurR family transcriptional regulator